MKFTSSHGKFVTHKYQAFKNKTTREKKKDIDDSNHSHFCSVLSKRFLFMFFSFFLLSHLLYFSVHSFKCVQYNSFMLVFFSLFYFLFLFLISYIIFIERTEVCDSMILRNRNKKREREMSIKRTEKVICFVFK